MQTKAENSRHHTDFWRHLFVSTVILHRYLNSNHINYITLAYGFIKIVCLFSKLNYHRQLIMPLRIKTRVPRWYRFSLNMIRVLEGQCGLWGQYSLLPETNLDISFCIIPSICPHWTLQINGRLGLFYTSKLILLMLLSDVVLQG